ncbi:MULTISPECIES: hypothetical protein [Stenotrophomonas]|uniref:hypothetical protein n=1 Tax=Stenotrophomonas TaxID=40323 RepID=UPI0018D38185|nr:hypothetical protein [Stenotrophomonas sp.]MBH1508375.1 hypothetical protein [Stenotrophomonas maltophilia]
MVETVLGMTELQIKLFTAIGQILVAAAVGLIAWRQWRTAHQQAETARNKLRLDLFERRIEAYNKLRGIVNRLIDGAGPEPAFYELVALIDDMRWLFGMDVMKRVREDVLGVMSDFKEARLALEGPQFPSSSLVDLYNECVGEARVARDELPEIFQDALTLLD